MLQFNSSRFFPVVICLLVSFSLFACGKRVDKEDSKKSAAALSTPTSLEGTWAGPCKALSGVNFYREVLSFNMANNTVTKSNPAYYDAGCNSPLNQASNPRPNSFSVDASTNTLWVNENGAYYIYKFSFGPGTLTMQQFQNLGFQQMKATGVVLTYTK